MRDVLVAKGRGWMRGSVGDGCRVLAYLLTVTDDALRTSGSGMMAAAAATATAHAWYQ